MANAKISRRLPSQLAKAEELEKLPSRTWFDLPVQFCQFLDSGGFLEQRHGLSRFSAEELVLVGEAVLEQRLGKVLGSFVDPDARDGFQKEDDPFFGYKVMPLATKRASSKRWPCFPATRAKWGR